MAKSRSKSRKGVRKPTRSKAARRPTRARATAAAPGGIPPPRKSIPLKQLRKELDLAVASLSRRVEISGGPSARVSEMINIFTRWADDIDNMCEDPNGPCGPTMEPPTS